MGYSSVAVFGFNRPGHLERCLTSLELNPEASKTNVHIYIDGPRRTTDLDAVTKSRHVANKKYRFLNTIVHFKETNSGLAKSVIEGLTEVLRENPRVIVLEDDLIVAENFLEFMNRGLENYEHNQDVASIQGFVYKMSSSIADSFFLRGADCWGWATWADRWFSCEWNASTLIKEISEKNLGDKFNLDGSYSFMKIL